MLSNPKDTTDTSTLLIKTKDSVKRYNKLYKYYIIIVYSRLTKTPAELILN